MKIQNLSENVEEFTANVYLINGKTLIDTGTGQELKNKLSQLEKVNEVLITHTHYDHVDNLEHVAQEHNPKIYTPEQMDIDNSEKIEDSQTITTNDGLKFKPYHTPGHKNNHYCFYNGEEKILFTGDLIFADAGFGRTDLAEGNRDKLINSIIKVQENTAAREFYPGHDKPITENAEQWIQKSLEEAQKHEKKYE